MVECRAWGPVMHVNSDQGYTYGILAETVYSTLVMQIAIMERFGCALKLSVSAFAFALHHINELRLKKKKGRRSWSKWTANWGFNFFFSPPAEARNSL